MKHATPNPTYGILGRLLVPWGSRQYRHATPQLPKVVPLAQNNRRNDILKSRAKSLTDVSDMNLKLIQNVRKLSIVVATGLESSSNKLLEGCSLMNSDRD